MRARIKQGTDRGRFGGREGARVGGADKVRAFLRVVLLARAESDRLALLRDDQVPKRKDPRGRLVRGAALRVPHGRVLRRHLPRRERAVLPLRAERTARRSAAHLMFAWLETAAERAGAK